MQFTVSRIYADREPWFVVDHKRGHVLTSRENLDKLFERWSLPQPGEPGYEPDGIFSGDD